MIAEFIKPCDPRWTSVLAHARHDFYHLPEYVEFTAKHEGGIPSAFYAEAGDDRFLAPLLIRDIPAELGVGEGWYDITAPYGYPSPILIAPEGSPSLAHFLEEFKHNCVEQGIVSAFFRFHPLLQLPVGELAKTGTLVHHGQTVYIDLTLSAEDIWQQMRRGHRRNIKQLHHAGFKVTADDWSLFDQFIAMYRETMERRSASEFYLFSDSYFYDLRDALGDRLHLHTVISPEGEATAAGLCVVVDGIVQDHLGASCNKYLRFAASKLGTDYLWRWAKDAGHKVVHMGGGVGGNMDTLFEYKSGFSKSRADFYTYRMILDESKYAILVRHRMELSGFVQDNNFFPEYRKPYVAEQHKLRGLG